MTWFGVTEENKRFGNTEERMRLAWRRRRGVSPSDVATVTRTEGQDDVDVTASFQPYVLLQSFFFYSATYGTFLIEFFIIIDLTCIIPLALAKQILTRFDIRTKNMFPTS